MGTTAIKVENLSKRYRIGLKEGLHDTLGDAVASWVRSPISNLRRLRGLSRFDKDGDAEDVIWALEDVSFEVNHGEIVGIVGRNGAGKTTLLKIISRITEPTSGRVLINGRVSSLLEVGTGFHAELTGRENIYLNGAILGMKKAEIDSKFDEIVAFAEIEKFIDTPVKRYSSGMYVRLAFAVAAHLEPEILLVDEVLAVGDLKFQNKCLTKMSNVSQEGRTVLFVSHAMAAVQSLCRRGMVIESGQVTFDGAVEEAIYEYIRSGASGQPVIDLSGIKPRRGNGDIRLTSFWIEDESGTPALRVRNHSPCTFVLGFEASDSKRAFSGLTPTIVVKTVFGMNVFYHHNFLTGQYFDQVRGSGKFRLHIPRLPLAPGRYVIGLSVSADRGRTLLDEVDPKATIEVVDGDFFGKGFEYRGGSYAVCAVDGSWSINNDVT